MKKSNKTIKLKSLLNKVLCNKIKALLSMKNYHRFLLIRFFRHIQWRGERPVVLAKGYQTDLRHQR